MRRAAFSSAVSRAPTLGRGFRLFPRSAPWVCACLVEVAVLERAGAPPVVRRKLLYTGNLRRSQFPPAGRTGDQSARRSSPTGTAVPHQNLIRTDHWWFPWSHTALALGNDRAAPSNCRLNTRGNRRQAGDPVFPDPVSLGKANVSVKSGACVLIRTSVQSRPLVRSSPPRIKVENVSCVLADASVE